MGKDPAALFYIDTWLSATAEMDADVRGWYLNLILHQFDKGSLPNDPEKLALLAGVKFSEFSRFQQVLEQMLKQKFKQNQDGRLENDYAKTIIQSRELFKEKRTRSGNIGSVLKLAKTIKGFNNQYLTRLKAYLYSASDEAIEQAKAKQVLEQMLKLYINGNENENINEKENEGGIKKNAPPTISEVQDYFFQNGYSREAGAKAWEYYNSGNWHDSKGNPVKNWKQKMQGVWFKDENLIVKPVEIPKQERVPDLTKFYPKS